MSTGETGERGKRATLRDVARLAKVHPATVSRALGEDTSVLVNAETVKRIREIAERLQYRPNQLARGLKTSTSNTIGVLVPDLMSPVIPPIVLGLERRLEQAGYTVFLGNTDHSVEREEVYLRAMRARQVDGMIIATASSDSPLAEPAALPDIPTVLVNRGASSARLSSAVPDDTAIAETAVAHLYHAGHRRIAHIAGPVSTTTGERRRRGFTSALLRRGIAPAPGMIVEAGRYTEDEGMRCLRELLALDQRPTAVWAATDLLALGCYDAIEEAGIECPGDISLLGCNDMPFASRFNPPLSTIRIAHDQLGVAAAELLLELLEDPSMSPREVRVPAELVARDSVGPPSRR